MSYIQYLILTLVLVLSTLWICSSRKAFIGQLAVFLLCHHHVQLHTDYADDIATLQMLMLLNEIVRIRA